MSGLSLAGIYRYPLKSAAGEALQAIETDRFGLAGDRRWLLVDREGNFMSQRSLPMLCRLQAETLPEGLRLTWAGDARVVPVPGGGAPLRRVTVWGDAVPARCVDDTVSDWLSACLGCSVALVHMPPEARRAIDSAYASDEYVSFADGFPLLVLSEASLEHLNAKLPEPVGMERFRPNLVIAGAAAHAEDGWQRLRIGDAELRLVKPCSRCVMPSIRQDSGERDPLLNRVLAGYRRRDGEIFFGMNALVGPGESLSVGDPVTVVA